MILDLMGVSGLINNPSAFVVGYSFLLAFVLGGTIALIYIKSFQGLSYSRNFLHCLVLSPILTAIVMQAIGDSVARGIGMFGALSILRFRTDIKDPRDMIFIFASLGAGLACGVHSFGIAVTGIVGFGLAVAILSRTPFAYGPQYDALLRLNLATNIDQRSELERLLVEHCKTYSLISLREMGQGEVLDYAYHLKFKKGATRENLVREIKALSSARAVNLLMQDSIVEI
jgi:uncharacterized membrane protein YhiD involved in acid resistance